MGKKSLKKKNKKLEDLLDEIDEKEDEAYGVYEKNKKKIDEKYEEKGYSKKEIEKMNRLIEIVE